MDDLKEECARLLAARLKLDNAIQALVLAHLCSHPALQESTISFIVENSKAISQADWKDLHKNHPDLYFQVTQMIIVKSSP